MIVAVRVAMNKRTGELGLVIPVAFLYDYREIVDYTVTVTSGCDGYLVFSGHPDADGPWLYVKELGDNVEILGEL